MTGVRYQIADLALDSEIALPELLRSDAASAVWTVTRAASRRRTPGRWYHHWRERDGRLWLSLGRAGDDHVLRFARTASFRVSLIRKTIVCEGVSTLPADTLRHLLLNQVLPLVIGSDRIVLHASAVDTPAGVIALAGPGGAGKSTLAAALCRAGGTFLTDDALIVERCGSAWHAVSAYGSLRLWPEAARAVLGPRVRASRVAHYTRKQRIDVGEVFQTAAGARPLTMVCVLDRPSIPRTTRVSMTPFSTRDAVVALTAASFHLDIRDRPRWKRMVEDFAVLAEALPVFRLAYPRRLSRLSDTAAEILELTAAAARSR